MVQLFRVVSAHTEIWLRPGSAYAAILAIVLGPGPADVNDRSREAQVLLILPLSLNVCRHDLRADNFDSIYKKCMQHFYLQINLLKN